MIIADVEEWDGDRTEEFSADASQCANGAVLMPSLALSKHERRLYIRALDLEEIIRERLIRVRGDLRRYDFAGRSEI